MPEERIDLYEGMFLVNQAAAPEMEAQLGAINQVLERGKAEVLVLKKWDERRLAFPIGGQRRGAYYLTYFRAPRANIARMERDVTLSETLLRCLITRADHVGETELNLEIDDQKNTEVEARLRDGGESPASEAPATEDKPAPAEATESSPSNEGADAPETSDQPATNA